MTLPKLTPEPGSTPDAVIVTAEFVPALGQARIQYTKSDAPDFAEYEIRMTPGPTWSNDDDSVIGNIADINTLEFLTTAGVETEGLTASYKVYVRTATGNQSGSDPVSVTRPVIVPPPPPPGPP